MCKAHHTTSIDVCCDLSLTSFSNTRQALNKLQLSVEKIHSVGTINNVKTSYSTQLKMLPNDNVSTSVRHLDHVLTVYSSMEQVTWKSPEAVNNQDVIKMSDGHRNVAIR